MFVRSAIRSFSQGAKPTPSAGATHEARGKAIVAKVGLGLAAMVPAGYAAGWCWGRTPKPGFENRGSGLTPYSFGGNDNVATDATAHQPTTPPTVIGGMAGNGGSVSGQKVKFNADHSVLPETTSFTERVSKKMFGGE